LTWPLVIAVLLVGLALTRWGPLVRFQRRWAWESVKRASEISEGLAGRPMRMRRRFRLALAVLVNRWTATPLQIEPLASDDADTDGQVIAEMIRTAITRVATLGPRAPVVATPFVARPLLSEVADAVSEGPQGRLLASLAQLLGRLVRRDELRLRGAVVQSQSRGPGLALSLTRINGDLIDSLTIWADEYEPKAPEASLDADPTARAMRVSTAAAVWAHFVVLQFRLVLPNQEYRKQLGTHDWQSYAYLSAGARDRFAPQPQPLARALFARAIDADPENLPAQYNLGLMETVDHDEVQATTRLESLQTQLEETAPKARIADALMADRETLDRDPFRYQVASIMASAALNRYTREARDGDPRQQLRWRRGILSRSDSEQLALDDFLGRIEPPMLMRWVMMGTEIGRRSKDDSPLALLARRSIDVSGALDRVELSRGLDSWAGLERGRLTPSEVVERLVKQPVWLTGNTRYELACYYAQHDDVKRALVELRHSFAAGEHRLSWSENDPQLADVRATDGYRALVQQYSGSPLNESQ
jgi:hypothetical protein